MKSINPNDSKDSHGSRQTAATLPPSQQIVEVWEDNFETELGNLTKLLEEYNYVALDTEFPGVCIQADSLTGYDLIRANVDALKLIQVGVSLSNSKGETPSPSTYQFNLRFDLGEERYSPESIQLLKDSGINFTDFRDRGIEAGLFAEELLSSGLILNEDVHWITFHGAFDFAYMLKVVLNARMPRTLEKFHEMLKVYFPSLFDLKIIVKEVDSLKNSSLAKLARDLDLKPKGTNHQAGSDSELTARCYFSIQDMFFGQSGGIPGRLNGKVYGLNNEYQNSQQAQSQGSFANASAGEGISASALDHFMYQSGMGGMAGLQNLPLAPMSQMTHPHSQQHLHQMHGLPLMHTYPSYPY